jgi:hypothetical protein
VRWTIQQPSVRKEIYELFGNTGMMQAFNKDATNARLENTAILNGAGWMGQPQAMVPETWTVSYGGHRSRYPARKMKLFRQSSRCSVLKIWPCTCIFTRTKSRAPTSEMATASAGRR